MRPEGRSMDEDQEVRAAITSEMIEAAAVALWGYQADWESSQDRAYAICLEVEKARRRGLQPSAEVPSAKI